MKRKARKADPLLGKRDKTSQLYRAVRRWVEEGGGSVMVMGGVVTIEWPGDGIGKFTVGIKCLGRKPKSLEDKKK